MEGGGGGLVRLEVCWEARFQADLLVHDSAPLPTGVSQGENSQGGEKIHHRGEHGQQFHVCLDQLLQAGGQGGRGVGLKWAAVG